MKVNDALTGVLLVAVAIAAFLLTAGAPTIHGSTFGAALFPRIVAGGMGLCGLYFIIKEVVPLVEKGKGNPLFVLPQWARSPWHLANCFLIIGSLVVYILFSDIVGFTIISTIILFAQFAWLRKGHLLSSFAIALIATFIIHYVFGHFLRVPLPWGVLTRYAFF
jgi:putative tricarboxylic transport membrane protein